MKIDIEFILRDCQNDLVKAQRRIDRVLKDREAAIQKLVQALLDIESFDVKTGGSYPGTAKVMCGIAKEALEAWNKLKE
jgi:hypothetical protein